MKRFSLLFCLGVSILACSPETLVEESNGNDGQELCFTAYLKDVATRTERQENTDVYWTPGDAVSIFFNQGDHGGSRFVAQNAEETAIAEFKGNITGFAGGGESTGGDFWFWGVYPYSENNSCDGSSVTLVLPALQTAKAGSFANGLFPTMARAKGLELGFYNICGGFKFSVLRDDIQAVIFRGNANESLAGKARIQWDENGHPAVVEHLEGKQEVIVSAPGGGSFVPGEEYYIVFFPEFLANGFSLTFVTADSKQGTFTYTQSRQINRGVFINAQNADQYVSSWVDRDTPNPVATPEGGTNDGLYLGLTYFGSTLSNYPAQLLTEDSIAGFNSFIDARTELDDETLLYYAVDKSMVRLQSNQFPDNLFSVAIVTFTDGQDDGSVGWKEDETGKTYYKGDYERELSEILGGTVQGLPVMAYSIGLKQSGVSSNTAFINSLQTIANPSTNYSLANNMSEVNERFSAIAQELSNTIKLQKLIGTIPRQATGTRIRFTYDNIYSGANSALYIEGVYNSTDYSLQNVVYVGLTSTSGTTVVGVRNKNKVTFTFEGVHRENNLDVSMDYFKRWTFNTDTSEWEEYTETSYLDSENGIRRELKSAVIMLNLDCTESLGEDNFILLKQYAKSFINTLYNSSIDPEAVASITLNKSRTELVVGETDNLVATINPSTAIDKSVTWTSSNPSVASVDNNGRIVALSVGSTMITVTSTDGGKRAQCAVSVLSSRPVQSVTLNKSQASIEVGKTLQLTASVLPTNATDRGIEWISSDESVATVSSTGLVSGLQLGSATIIAVSTDGSSCSASCEVDVTLPTTASSLSLAIVETSTGKKYYITQELYVGLDLTGFKKRGVVCGPASGSYFVLTMNDYYTKYHISGSQGLYQYVYDFSGTSANGGSRVLPNLAQAEWLSNNMTAANTALSAFGGTKMSTSDYYWTSQYRGNGYYYYFKSGVAPTLDSSGTKKCRVREVESL